MVHSHKQMKTVYSLSFIITAMMLSLIIFADKTSDSSFFLILPLFLAACIFQVFYIRVVNKGDLRSGVLKFLLSITFTLEVVVFINATGILNNIFAVPVFFIFMPFIGGNRTVSGWSSVWRLSGIILTFCIGYQVFYYWWSQLREARITPGKHVFLTGLSHIGKTALLQAFFDSADNAVIDGFVTYWERLSDDKRHLFIAAYGSDERHLLATDDEHGMNPVENISHVFNIHGCRILDTSGKGDFLVMDALGLLESGSRDFQRSVFKHLNGTVPVLGVISNKQCPFLYDVRNHPNVAIKEVTHENKDQVLKWLINYFLL